MSAEDDGVTPPVTTDYRFAQIPQDLLYDPAMSAQAVRIYGVLMRHGSDPARCYPSHERLGQLIGVSERSVQRPLAELVKAGWIKKVRRTNKHGERTSDGYHVFSVRADLRVPTAQEVPLGQRAKTSEEREQVTTNESNKTPAVVNDDAPNAGRIVKGFIDWCDMNGHARPANPGQLGKVVSQLLAAKHPPAAIKRALTTTSAFTLNAVEFELRRVEGIAPSRAQQKHRSNLKVIAQAGASARRAGLFTNDSVEVASRER